MKIQWNSYRNPWGNRWNSQKKPREISEKTPWKPQRDAIAIPSKYQSTHGNPIEIQQKHHRHIMETLQESNRNPIAIAKKSHKTNHRHILAIPQESNRNPIPIANKSQKIPTQRNHIGLPGERCHDADGAMPNDRRQCSANVALTGTRMIAWV